MGESGKKSGDLTGTAQGSVAERSSAGAIDNFLSEAKSRAPGNRGRMVFALDATMSRQPTWDLACRLQGEMFATAARTGGLDIQLVYFRGFAECRSSRWVSDATTLTALMTQIDCRGGHTQIGRVLDHVRVENGKAAVRVLVFVGDAMEENIDDLCARAGELAILGVRAFMFHEGHDPVAGNAFREIARITGGAYARFDASAPGELAALLRAAAAYAAGGRLALENLAKAGGREAQLLIGQMRQG
jgi:hypothetical protein